MLENIEGL